MNRIASIAAFIVVFLVGSLFGLGAGKMSSSTTGMPVQGQLEADHQNRDFQITFHLDTDESGYLMGGSVSDKAAPPGLDIAIKNVAKVLTEREVIEVAIFTKGNSPGCVWFRGRIYC